MARSQSSTRNGQAVTQLKQLCCLGLGPGALAPPLTRQLLRLIPGYAASIFFTDESGDLVNMYDENPAFVDVGPIYLNEFHKRREVEIWIGLKERFRLGRAGVMIEEIVKLDPHDWKRSDMYNEVFRPLGCDGGLRLAVRDGGRPLGGVAVSRSEGEREFTREDLDLLVSFEPYFAHAFDPPSGPVAMVESDADEDEGLIVAERDGRIRHISQQARVLLFYSTNEDVAPGRIHAGKQELPPRIAQLVHSFAEVFEGNASVAPPVSSHQNSWGEFVFRAYWLNGQGARTPLVAIRVSRREPLPVRLLRRMQRLPLSERQIEVSLHLASGKTYKEIAERLGVSRPTAIYHAQEAFNKLGVSSRAELQAKLMTL
ncbi:MAG TPA: helix-turn-helix transcriptional regulator [Xanthobacteraceae bacterium]